jgi:hypothetical protein
VILGICLALGCDYTLAGKWEYKETNRITSPDTQVDAVLVEGDAGATTSEVSKVYLLPKGTKLELDKRSDAVFAADHVKALRITWKQSKLLQIQYEEARILQFKNFWRRAELQDFRYVVEIRLEPTASDFSLPLSDRQ